MTGSGQCMACLEKRLKKVSKQFSITEQLSSALDLVHQPQSNPVPILAARHEEQPEPSCEQSYNTTVSGQKEYK